MQFVFIHTISTGYHPYRGSALRYHHIVFESPVRSGPVIGSAWALTETETG